MSDEEVILAGHGGEENQRVVRAVASSLGDVSVAFVDGEPALEDVAAEGEGPLLVVPVLLAGGHTLSKIREVLEDSGRPFSLAEPLGDHPGVVEAVRERIESLLPKSKRLN